MILKASTTYTVTVPCRDGNGNAAYPDSVSQARLYIGTTDVSTAMSLNTTPTQTFTGFVVFSFTTPADISSYLGKEMVLCVVLVIGTVNAPAVSIAGMFDTKITSDLLDFDSTNDPVYKCYLATDAELTDDMVSQIDYSIELVVGTTLGYTPDRAAYLDNIDGHTPQTGDSYAVVTNTTYGLAKLVRATTPANTLDIDANGEVTVGAFNSNLSFTTNQNNAIASYAGLALNSYGAAKTSDLSGLATAAALATVDTIVDAILEDTGTSIPGLINGLNNLSQAGVQAALTAQGLTPAAAGRLSAQFEAVISSLDGMIDVLSEDYPLFKNQALPLSVAMKFVIDKLATMLEAGSEGKSKYTAEAVSQAPVADVSELATSEQVIAVGQAVSSVGEAVAGISLDGLATGEDIAAVGQAVETLGGATLKANVTEIGGDAGIASKFKTMVNVAIIGNVIAGATSAIIPTNLTISGDDRIVNATMIFIGDMAGERAIIMAYDAINKTITVDRELTEVPTAGEGFVIV